jgi:asparagine N-glycosylation enzyme membrane subunit Stt3
MDLIKKVTKKSVIVIFPLILLSFLVDWNDERLKFIGLFGNPGLMAMSILIGGVIGLANLKGLVWGIESLLGTHRANTRMVFLSLLRLFILFALIIILVVMRLINLLGFLIGMTVVFLVLIREALRIAKEQGKEGPGESEGNH